MGRVRRGIFKMKQSWFKPKHQLSPANDTDCETPSIPTPGYIRPTQQQLTLAAPKDERGDFCHTATQMTQEKWRNVMLLRPKVAGMTLVDRIQLKTVNPKAPTCGESQPESEPDQRRGGYRFVDVNSAVELGAKAALDHHEKHPECDGQPRLLAEAEERRGLAVSEVMSCHNCGYKSEKTKLYNEIPHTGKKRGRQLSTCPSKLGCITLASQLQVQGDSWHAWTLRYHRPVA